MKITRSPGLPRGFVCPTDRNADFQLFPVSSERSMPASCGELYLPTNDGVVIVTAELSKIERWAVEIGGDLPKVIAELVEGVSHPRGYFTGLPLSEPVVMGVVNVTPDSFHDGGRMNDPEVSIAHGFALIEAGAGILDIGGESTRPGADPVSVQEEIDRVLPVIESVVGQGALISNDTRRVAVMRAALAAGVSIVNDVTALSEPGAIEMVRDAGASAILMHMQGSPQTMQVDPYYDHAPYEVCAHLAKRVEACERLGLSRDRIAVDPGIGFGKSDAHNFAILNALAMLHGIRTPIVLGVSRKSFIGRTVDANSTEDRLPGTIAATLHAVSQNVQIHRVHDVAEINQALNIWQLCDDANG
jgi:dihydropteroate synthase